jgi:hypothetical protein
MCFIIAIVNAPSSPRRDPRIPLRACLSFIITPPPNRSFTNRS